MYDQQRAVWMINHAGPLAFQRRRGQKMLSAIEDNKRARAGIPYNQHIQGVTDSIWLRDAVSNAGKLELAVIAIPVLVLLPAVPLAWWFTRYLEKQIPRHIASIPVLFLCSVAGPLCVILVLLLPASQSSGYAMLWLIWALTVYVPGFFFMTAMFGVLNGWLSVPGWDTWTFWRHTTRDRNAPTPDGHAPETEQ